MAWAHISTSAPVHLRIDVLIDRFVGDVFLGVVDTQSSGYLLRRETFHELAVHIPSYRPILETVLSSTMTAVFLRSLLCEARGVSLEMLRFVLPHFARD